MTNFSSQKNYVLPDPEKLVFTCQHCGALTTHLPRSYDNNQGFTNNYSFSINSDIPRVVYDEFKTLKLSRTKCLHCSGIHIFVEEFLNHSYVSTLVYPFNINYEGYEAPCEDMPEDIRVLYNEAAEVLKYSPRSSSALLRFALESLVKDICKTTPKKNNLAGYIEQFVNENAWATKYQPHLKTLRLIGNNAVHGEKDGIDFFEDKEQSKKDCLFLFNFLNRIADETYTSKRKDEEFMQRIGIIETPTT
ncbi:MAG: DUF4145 domain-containing protein [Vampirovibrionales bacterium]|jgi:hypothetical protein